MEPIKNQVFLSHAGDTSEFALHFHEWSSHVLQSMNTWCSNDRRCLELGYLNNKSFAEQTVIALEMSEAVIVFISPQNVDRLWLNFETGLSKGYKKHIFPILCGEINHADLAKNNHPLSCLGANYLRVNVSDIKDLFLSLNKYLSLEVDEKVISESVDNRFLELNDNYQRIFKSADSVKIDRIISALKD